MTDATLGRLSLAVDLGCGPGRSTRLLADILRPSRTVGLDSSEHYVALASESATDAVWFRLHDVTALPLPVGPVDLVFCRLLLSHLGRPRDAITGWATQLSANGRIAIEETESIDTSNSVLTTYIDILDTTMQAQGQQLFIGPEIDRIGDELGLSPLMNRVFRLKVPASKAAAMNYLNIQTWRRNSFVTENYDASVIDGLEADLKSLADDTNDGDYVEWGMRQLLLQRTD